MKLLEIGNDMKINHSVSAPQIWGTFFLKKALDGGTNFLGKFMGAVIRSCGEGRKSLTNAYSSNLITVNLKLFFGYDGRRT